MSKAVTHLEYLGYEIEEQDERVIWASHARLVDIYMADKPGGFLFFGWLKGNELAETHRPEFAECLNHLNLQSVALRFLAEEEGDLRLEAWYPKPYNRSGFANFIDLLNRDFQLLFSDDCNVGKYCAESRHAADSE